MKNKKSWISSRKIVPLVLSTVFVASLIAVNAIAGYDIKYQMKLFDSLAVRFKQKQNLTYRSGSTVNVKYYIRNATKKNFQSAKGPLSHTLYTLQKVDGSGVISALPKRSRSNVGYNIGAQLFYPKGPIKSNKQYSFIKSFSTKGFAPGKYRFLVELRLFDEYKNVIDKKTYALKFTIRK